MFQFDHPAEPAKLFTVRTSLLIYHPFKRIVLTAIVSLSMRSLFTGSNIESNDNFVYERPKIIL
jgi:hypothetical protein